MDDLHVRPAHADDAQAIADIYNHAVLNTTATFDTEPQSAEDRRAWLASPDTRVALVAVRGERVLGWGSLVRWSKRCAYDASAEISVYVAPDALRQGIGLMLSEELLQAARDVGIHTVISQACAENEASLAMTDRLGFERVGVLRKVGCKFGRRLDVVLLQVLLPAKSGATGDVTHDATGNAARDVARDATHDATHDATRDATHDATRDVEIRGGGGAPCG